MPFYCVVVSLSQGTRRTCAWKLFMLTSRLLLHRPPGERIVPREVFATRFGLFASARGLGTLASLGRVRPEKVQAFEGGHLEMGIVKVLWSFLGFVGTPDAP